MISQNANWVFEEESECLPERKQPNKTADEMEEKALLQLSKFQNPAQNPLRQAYIGLLAEFGDLLTQHQLQQISTTLLTRDCQSFLFSSTTGSFVKYSNQSHEEFKDIYTGRKIEERIVRETHIDLEKKTASQVCSCKVFYEDEEKSKNECSFEIFSFQDSKISKYRVCFGLIKSFNFSEDPLLQTRKDIMLAKVKEINYALAGYPDWEKVSSFLHEKVEYKIWSWDHEKCHILHKQNFASDFKKLEENHALNKIVPYELYSEGEYIIGTYVYHLQGKGLDSGQKFVWLVSCIYSFDKDAEIIKVNQQGELYPEEEAQIPFESHSRQSLTDKVQKFSKYIGSGLDLLYNDIIHPSCRFCRIGPQHFGKTGLIQGLNHIDKFFLDFPINRVEWIKLVDVFVDLHDPSYDVAIVIGCGQSHEPTDSDETISKPLNIFSLGRMCFENGKLMKLLQCYSKVEEPMPSPFDDKTISGINILPDWPKK